MAEQRMRRVHPRWAPVTRTSFSLVPALIPDVSARGVAPVRTPSDRHRELLRTLAGDHGWAAAALHACLTHLLTSTVTEASRVQIVDAWVGDDDDLCIVYRPPHDEARVVGLRRSRRDVVEPSDWHIGDTTTWGYDMRAPFGSAETVDPIRFGWNVADFDLGEPLGYVTTVLRYDDADVGWWGNPGDELPRPPRGEKPRQTS